MSRYKFIPLVLVLCSTLASAGKFSGELILYPEGCQNTPDKICKLGSELTYDSKDKDGLVWQTDDWDKDNQGRSGTTNGASIPEWAQPIIGDPYDESYLKAAIVHDHYCYEENQVRSWKTTHRMFYNALRDLGMGIIKAKTMYYAVYVGGPRWYELAIGQECGDVCIKSLTSLSIREESKLDQKEIQDEVKKMHLKLLANEELSLEELEIQADKINPVQKARLNDNLFGIGGFKDSKGFFTQ